MTREELIDHLQHLEQYTHYSEDAPALREVIEMLTERAQERTETHACDLIDRREAIAYAISGRIRTLPTSEDGENWIRTEEVRQNLLNLPPAQPDHNMIHLQKEQAYMQGYEDGQAALREELWERERERREE